jgi:predicted metal-dependent hydrolase
MAPTLRERHLDFGLPQDLSGTWTPSRPEFAAVANSVSLVMPFVEPYVVKATRAALADLSPELATRAGEYAAQELAHHVQHRRFNDAVIGDSAALRRLESLARRVYAALWKRSSLRFSVAFAAGSETIAYAIARWTHDHLRDVLGDADPAVRELFLWHLAEEVEHKEVAFDIDREVNDSPIRYLAATLVSLSLLAFFTVSGTALWLWRYRRLHHPVAWFRLIRWALSFFFVVAPAIAVSALPGHHPDQLADPLLFGTILRGHDLELDRSLGRTEAREG